MRRSAWEITAGNINKYPQSGHEKIAARDIIARGCLLGEMR
jgi:ribosomal protein L32